jgi:phenylacetate-CoA ligase
MRMTPEALQKVAEERLRRILDHAYQTSAYYRKTWDSAGFRPSPSFTSHDLQHLPFLTKDILKEHKTSLVSERYRTDQLDSSYTGGTTGTQTSFYLNRSCKVSRFGRQWGMLESCGYEPGMRRGLVWGVHDDLPPSGLRTGFRRWFRRYASSQEVLNCTVMDEHAMREYHSRLLQFRPSVIYGYPSALTELGRFIEDEGLEPIRVRRIITTAERLSSAYRRQLGRMFGGEVYDLYATREYGCIGFECRMHEGFHIDVGSVFVEILDGERPVIAGESGEIVITDLLNYGMPFIRSRSGDLGVLAAEPCDCGSPLPLLKGLDGRSSDVVYRPDGSVVPGLILTDFCADIESIRLIQFVQSTVDRIDVLVVATESFSEQARNEIVRHVRQVMSDDIAVHVERIDDLERNPRSGKLREVICTVDSREIATAGDPSARE